MNANEDYSKMTSDELDVVEKKVESHKTLTAILIGFFVGVAMWSAIHNEKYILTAGLLISAFVLGSSYTKKRKSIREEISRRNTVG